MPSLFVPPMAAKAAVHEIAAFEREKPPLPLPSPPDRRGVHWYIVLLAALVPWHRVRWNGLLHLPGMPDTPQAWLSLAGLDAYRVFALHEWWRAATALTLHADGAHLIANVVMGGIFGLPLCRYTGVGFAFFLTLAAGCCGNLVTAYLRPASFLSQGFSTAVFASAGLLAAFAAAYAARHAYATAGAAHRDMRRRDAVRQGILKGLVPLGAGLGFLAMLGGSEAPNVDYLAHTMGLFSGMALGLGVALLAPSVLELHGAKNTLFQSGAVVAASALLVLAWKIALR